MVLATHDLNLAASVCDRLVLVRSGRILAQGPTREVLTGRHQAALRRRSGRPRARTVRSADGRADQARAVITSESAITHARHSSPIDQDAARVDAAGYGILTLATCLLAPLVGSTSINFSRVSIDRSRSPTTSTHRSSSSHVCLVCWRGPSSARRSPRPVSCCRRCCGIHWPRRSPWECRPVRRLAPSWPSPSARLPRSVRSQRCPSRASAAHCRRGDRLCTRHQARTPDVHVRASACRRHTELVLLCADSLRPVHGGLHRNLQDRAMADG